MKPNTLISSLCILCLFALAIRHAIASEVVNIGTHDLLQQLRSQPDTVLIDVRTPDEIKQVGTIGIYQNVNIPRGYMESRIVDVAPDKDTPIIVYCGRNLRSPPAAMTLMSMGYGDVKNYDEGYFIWKQQGLEVFDPDRAPASILFDLPKRVIDDVYTAIGAAQPSTYENSGHNNNLSFIIADDAVVLFNAGASYLIAQSMHDEIRKITDLPVRYVVLENAQGHAMLGSIYWQQQGAKIIAHEITANKMHHEMNRERITDDDPGVLGRYQRMVRDKMHRTEIVLPDITFKDEYVVPVDGKHIELKYFGASHSEDNILLWMPKERLLITGDYAFNERMLPILDETDARNWLALWPRIEALDPAHIIPGHGDVTDLATIRHFTVDYLEFLLGNIDRLIEDGGTLLDAYNLDQRRFQQWKTFRELSRLNAEKLYRKLEFE